MMFCLLMVVDCDFGSLREIEGDAKRVNDVQIGLLSGRNADRKHFGSTSRVKKVLYYT